MHWAFENANFHQPISSFSNITNIPGFGMDQRASHHFNSGISETHIFSPALLGEFRVGWNRYDFNYFAQADTKDWCLVLAIKGCDDDGPIDWDVPQVSLNSVYSTLGGGTGQVQYGPFDTYFFDPTFTWSKGKHTVKFGWDYHHYFTNSTNGQSPRGTFTFNGKWTGNPLADLLLGLPFQASKIVISNEPKDVLFFATSNQTAAFAQDDFRVSQQLTLNLGLRYDLGATPTEQRNHAANMDLSQGVANAVLQIAGQGGVGSKLFSMDRKEFAPRFGFAYTPRDKWVMRGGYGIFYQLQVIGNNGFRSLHNNPPFQSTYTIVGDGNNITINDALVEGLVANVPSFAAISPYLKAGMVQQFSLGTQHELPWGLLLDVGYVGTRGRDINNTVSVNTPFPGPGTVQTRRPNVNYQGITALCPCTASQYDGFEMRVEKRFSKGMQFVFADTLSRSYDNTGTPQDPHNLRAQWGPSGYDVLHHLSINYVYHVPVGKGLSFLGNMNKLGDAILGGWQINGIYQFHSGQPFTPILPIDNSNTQVMSDRPNLVGDPFHSTSTCRTRTPICWVNAAAFATPPQYIYGTAGTNEVRGPNFSQLDFAMAKNFTIAEKRRIEFRAEAFNVFNHVNFYNPNATLSSTFGVISSAQPSRQLQFGARFVF